jgi:phage terminase large subunit-like protein
MEEIRPQPGPQEDFLSSSADIVIFGGAAFGGKSYGLLLESTRHVRDPRYNGVIFRRESPQITSGGGLWDTASQIYPAIGGDAKEHKLTYIFPTNAYIKFTHLQHETDKLNHQGAQYVFIGFDELTHFTEGQFWYLLTRNRPPTGCNIRPYCRCTTNPEADSWVRDLIEWWIDDETGYAIKERSGILRYFTRINDEIIWVDKDWKDEEGNGPKSITFIPSYIDDNPKGIEADPTYKSNLMAQDTVTRERLLSGNWNITYKGGMFDPTWFKIIEKPPEDIKWIRYWDRAATIPKDEDDDPDWNAGAKIGMYGGELYIADVKRFRETSAQCEKIIKQCAVEDGYDTTIGYEIEPGSSGIEIAAYYQTKVLKGFEVQLDRPTGKKEERCRPWCALAEHGHVYLVKGSWNRPFLAEAGSFPFGKKDQIDSVSGGYKLATREKYVWPLFKLSNTYQLDIKWEEAKPRKTLHYGSIVQLKDLSVWFLEALWDDVMGMLYVYGCWSAPEANPIIHVPMIIERMKQKKYITENILANGDMFTDDIRKAPATYYRKEYRKRLPTIRVGFREAIKYDQMGAIVSTNQMFARKAIYVAHEAKPAARQFASWTVEKGKPAKEDCGYCIALCQIVSELRRRKLLIKEHPIRDYKQVVEKHFIR